MPYICPICHSSLNKDQLNLGYFCEKNHHFDQAKEGYLNLLPVQYKKSKKPGDSKVMMHSRRQFLEAGFYQPLAKAIVQIIDGIITENATLHLLDIGCGEGYYTRQIQQLSHHNNKLEIHGLDISKHAISAAAKKQRNAQYIVASSNSMPYQDNYFDLLMQIYAPANLNEIDRLLKNDGILIVVTPGSRHLWQLKEFIYKEVKQHEIDSRLPNKFELIKSQRICYKIKPEQQLRLALLQMTPFAWKANEQIINDISQAKELEIETDFILSIAKKNDFY